MVLAKYTYFLQELFDIPIGLQFQKHNFGPYSPDIKKAILGSAFNKDKFFKVSGSEEKQVYDLGQNSNNLFKYKNIELQKAEAAMKQFAVITKNLPSQKIELLATVCKIIQDTKTSDLKIIRLEMKNWETDKREFKNKADIFDEESTAKCLLFIKKQGWDAKLTQE
jgi:hypothetical protein